MIVTVPGGPDDPIPYADRHNVFGIPHGFCIVQKGTFPVNRLAIYNVYDINKKFLHWSYSLEIAARDGLSLTCPAKHPPTCRCWNP